MSQSVTNITQAVTLDANGQATVTFTDGGANLGSIRATLVTALDVATKIELNGAIVDSALDGSWQTTGAPLALSGATVVVTFDGGSVVAGVTGTVVFGVSPV